MAFLDWFNAMLNRGLAFVASLSLIAMMLVTVGEMVSRMFGHPMAGTIETTTWLAAVTTAFALGYTQIHRGHVSIDLFVNRLGLRLRAVINMLMYLTLTALFMIVTWNLFLHAGVLRKSGSLSETMKVIVYPWVYLASLGCAGLTLALIVDFVRSCMEAFSRRNGREESKFSHKPKGDK
ncbi:MAG: TRAP transporter small permease [Deltaproteobacteria bacterium]|nr:TRAP transporter small permease [Deltaproteobacteria bacterium]